MYIDVCGSIKKKLNSERKLIEGSREREREKEGKED